ncbi:MAG: hypothetical protein MK086_13545 [Flavobacteriales bacterium]|nr:hypothetical protein [Flavobacteriales bacterium]
MNLTGIVVETKTFNSSAASINLNASNPGLYIYSVLKDGQPIGMGKIQVH